MIDDKFYDELSALINGAFDSAFGRKLSKPKPRKPVMQQELKKAPVQEQSTHTTYESIEDYTNQTGKRFRMLKEQKERGLSREEAFVEIFGGSN